VKKIATFFIVLSIVVILSFLGCNSSNTAPQDQEKKISKKELRKAKIAKHLERTRKLLTVAENGTDENITYARLTPENNYADPLGDALVFTRDFASGPGTGKFTSRDKKFEFTRGNCRDVINISDPKEKKKIRWKKKIKKCQESILECDWCARLKEDTSVSYTISFLSWTIKNEDCVGDCNEHDNLSSYIRMKYIQDKQQDIKPQAHSDH
jgi:hypothetical protein